MQYVAVQLFVFKILLSRCFPSISCCLATFPLPTQAWLLQMGLCDANSGTNWAGRPINIYWPVWAGGEWCIRHSGKRARDQNWHSLIIRRKGLILTFLPDQSLRWINDEANVRTPPKLGRNRKIYTLCPRDFQIPPSFWWSTDTIRCSSLPNLNTS